MKYSAAEAARSLQYVCPRATRAVALKPANVSLSKQLRSTSRAITALQAFAIREKFNRVKKFLINGASGGVGTFAVQIAKSFGADVTAVCSTRNVDLVQIARCRSRNRLHKGGFHEERSESTMSCSITSQTIRCRMPRRPDTRRQIRLHWRRRSRRSRFSRRPGKALKATVFSKFVSQQMGMMMADSNQQGSNHPRRYDAVRETETGD